MPASPTSTKTGASPCILRARDPLNCVSLLSEIGETVASPSDARRTETNIESSEIGLSNIRRFVEREDWSGGLASCEEIAAKANEEMSRRTRDVRVFFEVMTQIDKHRLSEIDDLVVAARAIGASGQSVYAALSQKRLVELALT
jgi:hypothetical protein